MLYQVLPFQSLEAVANPVAQPCRVSAIELWLLEQPVTDIGCGEGFACLCTAEELMIEGFGNHERERVVLPRLRSGEGNGRIDARAHSFTSCTASWAMASAVRVRASALRI